MALSITSIRLDKRLADEAAAVLGVKSRTEAIHVALREIVALKRFKKLVRNSAVVLEELSRAATKPREQEFVERLARNHAVLTPTENNWLDSGRLLSTIHAAKGFGPEKLRDLHFDVLIALTARSVGARLVTSNRADFELIASYRKLQLEFW